MASRSWILNHVFGASDLSVLNDLDMPKTCLVSGANKIRTLKRGVGGMGGALLNIRGLPSFRGRLCVEEL